jgi:hypothetical protein
LTYRTSYILPFYTPTSPLPSCPASTGKTVLIVQSNGTYTAVHQSPSRCGFGAAGRGASALRSRLGNLLSVSLTCKGDESIECLLSCGTCASESSYTSQMTTPGSVSALDKRKNPLSTPLVKVDEDDEMYTEQQELISKWRQSAGCTGRERWRRKGESRSN